MFTDTLMVEMQPVALEEFCVQFREMSLLYALCDYFIT